MGKPSGLDSVTLNVKPKKFCPKCRRTLDEAANFYKKKDGSTAELCKSCLTMHVDNYNPDTFISLLKEFDVPYIEREWNVLRDRAYQKDPYKMNGMTVFGRYLSKMKLNNFSCYTFADTERLKQKAADDAALLGTPEEQFEQRKKEMQSAMENGSITKEQYKHFCEAYDPTPNAPPVINPIKIENGSMPPPGGIYPTNAHPFEDVEIPDVSEDLTDEDKIYLAVKWGRYYTAEEWVSLEEQFNEYQKSFDIQDAARIDTLKKICTTSLKMDQALGIGDVENYQKLSKVYEALMKAGKFTEAQKREDRSGDLTSFCQVVAYCESKLPVDGVGIPSIDLEVERDVVDRDLKNIKQYTADLIKEDPAVFKQIESYLKKREIAEETAKLLSDPDVVLTDEDLKEFNDSLEEMAEADFVATNGEEGEQVNES